MPLHASKNFAVVEAVENTRCSDVAAVNTVMEQQEIAIMGEFLYTRTMSAVLSNF